MMATELGIQNTEFRIQKATGKQLKTCFFRSISESKKTHCLTLFCILNSVFCILNSIFCIPPLVFPVFQSSLFKK